MGKLTEEEMDALKEAFMICDFKSDSVIPTKELGTVLRQLGRFPSEVEVRQMLNELGKDSSSTFNFNDLTKLMSDRMSEEYNEQALSDAFRAFDMQGNGLVSAEELRHVATHLGEPLTEVEANEMMKYAKPDENGFINYKKFIEAMRK